MWNITFTMYGDPKRYVRKYLVKEHVLIKLMIANFPFIIIDL